jgi:peptidoglycan hydrolase-like protein with peptidoglycan-binding domain
MVERAFPTRVLVGLVLAIVLIGGVVVAGAVLREDDQSSASGSGPEATTTSTVPTTTTTTLPATTTTTLPALQQPAPAPELPIVPLYGTIGPGSDPAVVAAFQQRLHDLKFDPGAVDGNYSQAMSYAVQAVQKIHGLDRNGRIGALERDLLVAWQYPPPVHHGAELDRTEIDIAKQVITLYKGNQVALITTTSTASGETFCYVTPKKAPTQRICEVATTPNGRYQYYFFYDGWQNGDLGSLYNPYYFFKGRAIHGYDSVPAEPASHGCSRIPMHIATYWHSLVTEGEAVYVDGGPANGEQIISSQAI